VTKFKMQERDFDLMILEELHSDSGFSEWFSDALGLNGAKFISAEHSVSADAAGTWGETDVLAYFAIETNRIAVLIENKIAARFQERQAERYHERARDIIAKGLANDYRTILIAPQSYLDGTPPNDPWHHRISMGAMAEWFASKGGSHAKRRALALDGCLNRIGRNNSATNGDVMRFSGELSEYLSKNTDDFFHNKQTTNNSWGLTIGLRRRIPNFDLVWKVNQNYVDLCLRNENLGKITVLDVQPEIEKLPTETSGFKCDMLRIQVAQATWSDPLLSQSDVVNEVINACRRLHAIALELERRAQGAQG